MTFLKNLFYLHPYSTPFIIQMLVFSGIGFIIGGYHTNMTPAIPTVIIIALFLIISYYACKHITSHAVQRFRYTQGQFLTLVQALNVKINKREASRFCDSIDEYERYTGFLLKHANELYIGKNDEHLRAVLIYFALIYFKNPMEFPSTEYRSKLKVASEALPAPDRRAVYVIAYNAMLK